MTKTTKATKSPAPVTAAKAADKAVNAAAFYEPFIARWQPEKSGPVVTRGLIDVVCALKPRPGVEMLHIAMCLRAGGCTVDEYRFAGANANGVQCGPANNNRKALIEARLLNVEISGGKTYRFKCVLTAKGVALCTAAGVKPPKCALPATVDAKAAADRAAARAKRAATNHNRRAKRLAAKVAALEPTPDVPVPVVTDAPATT